MNKSELASLGLILVFVGVLYLGWLVIPGVVCCVAAAVIKDT